MEETLEILGKYVDEDDICPLRPTIYDDILRFFADADEVSEEDKKRLDELGVHSYRSHKGFDILL